MASDRITCREYDFTVKPFESGYKLIPACRSFLLRRVVDSDGENRSLKIQLGKIEESTIEYITAENGLNLFVGSFFDILRYKNDSTYNLHVRFLVSPDILESSSVVSASGGGTVKIENAKDDDGNIIPLEVIEKSEPEYWDFTILECYNNGNLFFPSRTDKGGLERFIVILHNVSAGNIATLKIAFQSPYYFNDYNLYFRERFSDSLGNYRYRWVLKNAYECLYTKYIDGFIFPITHECWIGGGLFRDVFFNMIPSDNQIENGKLVFML